MRRSLARARGNVIDVKSGFLQELRKMAVFANLAGAVVNQPYQRGRDMLAH
jgi:hypothetical protein